MRLTARGKGFLVYDDVLDRDAFQNLWVFMQRTQYCWVHAQGWLKAWRLTDGMPLGGPACYSDSETAMALNPSSGPPPKGLSQLKTKPGMCSVRTGRGLTVPTRQCS